MGFFPFNGMVISVGTNKYGQLEVSQYALLIGTTEIVAYGSKIRLHHWVLCERIDNGREIIFKPIATAWPAGTYLIEPYWVLGSGFEFVEMFPFNEHAIFHPSFHMIFDKHPNLIFGHGRMIGRMPMVGHKGWVIDPTVPSGSRFGIASYSLITPKCAQEAAIPGIPTPSLFGSVHFIPAEPWFCAPKIGLYRSEYPTLDIYASSLNFNESLISTVELKPPLVGSGQWNEMIGKLRALEEQAYRSWNWKLAATGRIRFVLGTWDVVETTFGPFPIVYKKEFFDYGSKWVIPEPRRTYFTWDGLPVVPSSSRDRPSFRLFTPVWFITDSQFIPLTKELCDKINQFIGMKVIDIGSIRLFGFWPCGSFAVWIPRTSEPAWLPQMCLVDIWAKFNGNFGYGTRWVFEAVRAYPVPSFIFFVERHLDCYFDGYYWSFRTVHHSEELSVYDFYAEFLPFALLTDYFELPDIDYDTVIDNIAEIIRLIARRRVWVLSNGLETPITFLFGTTGLLWRATINWALENFSLERPERVLTRYYDGFGGATTYWRIYHGGPVELFGSATVYGSYYIADRIDRVGATLDSVWPLLDRWRDDGTATVQPCDPWTAGRSHREETYELVHAPYLVPWAAYNWDLRITDHLGIPTSHRHPGQPWEHHFIIRKQAPSFFTNVAPEPLTASCVLDTLEHDGVSSLVALVSVDADWRNFARWYFMRWLAIEYATHKNKGIDTFEICVPFIDEEPLWVPRYSAISELISDLLHPFGPISRYFFLRSLYYYPYAFPLWEPNPHVLPSGLDHIHGTMQVYSVVGLCDALLYIQGSRLPNWMTVFEPNDPDRTEIDMPGHFHAHPAWFMQVGRAVDFGSVLQTMHPFYSVLVRPNSLAGTFALNTSYGPIRIKAFEIGMDPLWTTVASFTIPLYAGTALSDQIKRNATLPPGYIDIRLIDYESHFTPFDKAFVGTSRFNVGSYLLRSVQQYILGERGVAIGSPFNFFEVFWTKARLPKFGWPVPVRAWESYIWGAYRYWFLRNLFDFGGVKWEYKTSYIRNPEPWHIFRACTPTEAERLIAQSPIFQPIKEVFPLWVAVRTKAELTYFVSPFGVIIGERFIRFPHIPPDVVCFHVNAYPLLDGYLVAHIYTGSGVHTYIVDGEKIVKWAFDTVPLHVKDFFKLRR